MAKGLLGCCILFLLGVTILAERIDPVPPREPLPAPAVMAAAALPAPVQDFSGSVTLKRDPDSHFYAEAQVNGARVRFVVDTGATGIVLTSADAQRAGIGGGEYSARGVGAGGEVRLKPVTLGRIAVGGLSAHNVPAMVAERDALPVSLLGQSWLARLGSVTIEGDQMVLR